MGWDGGDIRGGGISRGLTGFNHEVRKNHYFTQPIELVGFFQWKIIDLSIKYAYFLNFREFFRRGNPCNETDYIVCAITLKAVRK